VKKVARLRPGMACAHAPLSSLGTRQKQSCEPVHDSGPTA